MKHSRPFSVSALFFLQIFLGLNGLMGGGAFLIAPDGRLLQIPVSYLNNTPFHNFLIPGLLLFMFLGVYPMFIAFSLWKQPVWRRPDLLNPFKQYHWSWTGSLTAGVIAMIWILVQIQWIPVGFLHIFVFSWGVLILLVTLLPVVRRYCRSPDSWHL